MASDDPDCANILTRPPTGTPRRAIFPGEGLLIPQRLQREQADCSSLRASSDHRFIVGALRARRTVCLLPRILLRPRVARARESSRLPRPPFQHPASTSPARFPAPDRQPEPLETIPAPNQRYTKPRYRCRFRSTSRSALPLSPRTGE